MAEFVGTAVPLSADGVNQIVNSTGPATRQAIMRFQNSKGLQRSGDVDDDLLKGLMS